MAWEGVGDSVARLPAARPLAKAAANVCLLPSPPAAEHGLSGGAVPSTSMGDIPSGVGGGKRGAAPESMLPPGR